MQATAARDCHAGKLITRVPRGAPPVKKPSGIGEMLDQVKNEYKSAVQQLNMTKMEQIEVERKLQAQVVEMDQIQQTLKTLEANHRRTCQQYEEDIMRMRRQLKEQRGAGVKPAANRLRMSTKGPGMGKEGDSLMLVASASRSLQQLGQPLIPVDPPSLKPPVLQQSAPHSSQADATPTSTNSSSLCEPSLSSGSSNGSSSKASSSEASKLNWKCLYNENLSTYPDSKRPVAELHQTMDHQSVVCCVRLSPDGTMMATGCHKTARVFDVKSGESKFMASSSVCTGDSSASIKDDAAYVRAVAFSPGCTKIVAGMPRNTIRVWDIATSEEGPAMTGHEAAIYGLDCVGNMIVSGSGDCTARLWDARTGQCKKIFGSESGGLSDGVTSVALSLDGRYLAAGSLDSVVRIWDTESSQLLDRFEGHSDSVYSIAFSPDGRQLISGAQDHNVMLWDVNAQGRTSSRPRTVFQGHKDFVLSVAYSPDGRLLMSGSKDRSVVFWDPRSSRSLLTLTGYRNSVISVAASPASPYFATGSGDCLAVVWKYGTHSRNGYIRT